jgi:hypothetical protein
MLGLSVRKHSLYECQELQWASVSGSIVGMCVRKYTWYESEEVQWV